MAYLEIENFKFGLDGRRCELTANPGSLVTLQNAHINQGGEAERRKAIYVASILKAETTTTLGDGTYVVKGLEIEPSGAVVFGSAATPGTLGTYPTFDAQPLPVSYQRLQEPYATGNAMSEVVASCLFNQKSFVIAKFATSNRTVLFYNGTAIVESYAGVLFGNLGGSNNNLAAAIRDWINASIGGYTASVVGAVVTVTHSSGGSITPGASVSGGAAIAVSAAGASVTFTVTSSTANSTVTIFLTVASVLTLVGYNSTFNGLAATFCYAFGNRVYLLAGAITYFSTLGSALTFVNVNGTGNGSINLSQYSGTGENLVTMCQYQGKLAFFFRNSIQIWTPDANPSLFSLLQILDNIGCVAKRGACPVGTLDVIFVSDCGIRSLRARDLSLNAVVTDVGSPVDLAITTLLNDSTTDVTNIATGVEPSANRFWVSIPTTVQAGIRSSTLYVLSYFPAAKIVAWGTYTATYALLDTGVYTQTIVYNVDKMIVHNGALYMMGVASLATGGVPYSLIMGYDPSRLGSSSVYDNCPIVVETPWLSADKPGTNKSAMGLSVIASGKWTIKCGMDTGGGVLSQASQIGNTASPSITADSTNALPQAISFNDTGKYFKFQASSVESGTATPTQHGRMTLASFLFFYKLLNEVP